MKSTVGALNVLAVLLFTVLVTGGAARAAGSDEAPAENALLDAPVPYFHTYNLTSLYPVGQAVAAQTAAQGSADGDALTLEQCIDRALENNPAHNKTRENMRAVTGDILTAWGNYLPTLRAGYGLSQNNRTSSYLDPSGVLRTSGGISKSSYASLRAGLTLFDAASHYFDMKNARYLEKQRRQNYESSELGLVDQVRRAYYNALAQQQLLQSAENRAESLRDQLRLAEARHSVGSVTRLDVLQAQVDLQDQELVIVERENGLDNAIRELNRLMGGELDRRFALVDNFRITEPDMDVDSALDRALEQHPDIMALNYQIKQIQGNLWMGRLAYLPTVSTDLSYSRSEDGLELIPNRDKGRGLGLSVSWNIWDSFARFSRNRYTEVQLNNLKYDLASRKLEIENAIRQYYAELVRLFRRHEAMSENVDLRRQSLELQEERYRLGAASLLELRQAQVDFSQAEINYINSRYDFYTTLSTLSRNLGWDLGSGF